MSIDATLRGYCSLQGQASYKASQRVKVVVADPDSDRCRRVFTIRGRAGVVLAMAPVSVDTTTEIVRVRRLTMPEAALC